MKSKRYFCPVCEKPLDLEKRDVDSLGLWCAYGPCPSYAANDGAEGATESEAYYELVRKVEAEQEKQPRSKR